jgi:hypothetical protein
MINSQQTQPHLRIAHKISEAIMLRDFTKRQRKILDLILRLSWGCGKKIAYIPRQKDFTIIGIAESHISQELRWLVASNVILVDGDYYSFNEDFHQWQVSRVKPYEPEKLNKLVSLNLNHVGQNSEVLGQRLPKIVSEKLPKQEVRTYQNSRRSTSGLALSKEKLQINIKEIEIPQDMNTEIIYLPNGEIDQNRTIIHYQRLWTIRQILRGKLEATDANKQIYRAELSRLGISVEAKDDSGD